MQLKTTLPKQETVDLMNEILSHDEVPAAIVVKLVQLVYMWGAVDAATTIGDDFKHNTETSNE